MAQSLPCGNNIFPTRLMLLVQKQIIIAVMGNWISLLIQTNPMDQATISRLFHVVCMYNTHTTGQTCIYVSRGPHGKGVVATKFPSLTKRAFLCSFCHSPKTCMYRPVIHSKDCACDGLGCLSLYRHNKSKPLNDSSLEVENSREGI